MSHAYSRNYVHVVFKTRQNSATPLIDSTVAATDVVRPSVLRAARKRVRASKDALEEAIKVVTKNRVE